MPYTGPAPGADDNGSGVASLLLAANALVKFPHERTILFVSFSGEDANFLLKSYFGSSNQKVLVVVSWYVLLSCHVDKLFFARLWWIDERVRRLSSGFGREPGAASGLRCRLPNGLSRGAGRRREPSQLSCFAGVFPFPAFALIALFGDS